jgi:aspartate carbamoyltransferase catalytic subunit
MKADPDGTAGRFTAGRKDYNPSIRHSTQRTFPGAGTTNDAELMHIISIKDFNRNEIDALLNRAQDIHSNTRYERTLEGKLVALLFFEPSTRTRMSFASALARLGGTSITVDSVEGSSIIKGETLADTIRVVSGYVDAIVLRHPREGAARLASEFASVPVINAGDGAGQHPSQTLLDLFTIRQSMPLEHLDVGMLGDLRYGRTAHSLAYALSHYDVTLHTIAPNGLEMPENLVEELKDKGTEMFEYSSVTDILQELDVLYVTRLQRERFPDSASYSDVAQTYRITPELLVGVKESLIILHPLPRAGEIDPRVDTLPYARYFEQARNGIPVRMAMLEEVMK